MGASLMGSSAPWRSELIISPCVPILLGMVLHIKRYTLHGLISHRDHSNFNHISSSILLNMCIKSLIHQLTAQRHYTSLQYKSGEKDKASYWLVSTGKGNFIEETSSKTCKWVMWSGDFQASRCNEGQGCKKCYPWVPL
jgi:hypothetical protein